MFNRIALLFFETFAKMYLFCYTEIWVMRRNTPKVVGTTSGVLKVCEKSRKQKPLKNTPKVLKSANTKSPASVLRTPHGIGW
jgi:hypothetical protein